MPVHTDLAELDLPNIISLLHIVEVAADVSHLGIVAIQNSQVMVGCNIGFHFCLVPIKFDRDV